MTQPLAMFVYWDMQRTHALEGLQTLEAKAGVVGVQHHLYLRVTSKERTAMILNAQQVSYVSKNRSQFFLANNDTNKILKYFSLTLV